MQQLEQRVADTIARGGLIPAGARLIVAVSGGADSVALLLLLTALRDQANYTLIVAHLNHAMREAAVADAIFVQQLAHSLDLTCELTTRDVPTLAAARGISLEMAAREARYDFLATVAQQHAATHIAVAHHADDQAETLLLNLTAGSGTAGAGGMQPSRPLGACHIVRPLLEITKAELLAYLASHHQAWCEDASNTCLDYRRNRVRHQLLPLLQAEFNPHIVGALARFSKLRREEERWMSMLAEEQLAACLDPSGGLNAERLLDRPLAAQRRIVHRWLKNCGLGARRLSQETIEGVLTFATKAAGSCRHSLPGRWQIVSEYGWLRAEQTSAPHAMAPWEVLLALPGTTMLPELGLQLTARPGRGIRRDQDALPGSYPRFATIRCPEPADAPLILRTRRPGDRITPCGMPGSRKLKQVWIDLKVPQARRDSMPVVACGDSLVWVPGYGVAAAWAVLGADEANLTLTLDKPPRRRN